jgi:hypothetical protein
MVEPAADAEPLVDVPVRAVPVVHYTINSTVNGHLDPIDTHRADRWERGFVT